jgi:hypothetical protein
MAVGDQVGTGELPDVVEESGPVEAREGGDARLTVEAHAIAIGDGHEEQIEGGGLRRETAQVPAADQAPIDPGEADAARPGKPSDPVRSDRGMPEVASSRRALSRVAHCQISRPQA